MRVLILGGTHFIGPFVVRELDKLGAAVTVYHRGVHEPALPSAVRHVHHPSASLPFLHFPSELTQPPPDIVLHMFPVGASDTAAAMTRFTGTAGRMVAISSGDVYRAYGRLIGTEPDSVEPKLLNEDASLRQVLFPYRSAAAGPNDWTYDYEKILVERAVLSSPQLPGTILRLPAVYGPGDPQRRFRQYLRRMYDNRPAIFLDASQSTWRWTHGYVENVAAAIVRAIVDERAVGRVFNVGEENTPMTSERVAQMAREVQWSGAVIPMPFDRLPPHLRPPYEARQDLVMDTGRLRRELDFIDPVTRQEGLRRTIDWELTHAVEGEGLHLQYAAEDDLALSG